MRIRSSALGCRRYLNSTTDAGPDTSEQLRQVMRNVPQVSRIPVSCSSADLYHSCLLFRLNLIWPTKNNCSRPARRYRRDVDPRVIILIDRLPRSDPLFVHFLNAPPSTTRRILSPATQQISRLPSSFLHSFSFSFRSIVRIVTNRHSGSFGRFAHRFHRQGTQYFPLGFGSCGYRGKTEQTRSRSLFNLFRLTFLRASTVCRRFGFRNGIDCIANSPQCYRYHDL